MAGGDWRTSEALFLRDRKDENRKKMTEARTVNVHSHLLLGMFPCTSGLLCQSSRCRRGLWGLRTTIPLSLMASQLPQRSCTWRGLSIRRYIFVTVMWDTASAWAVVFGFTQFTLNLASALLVPLGRSRWRDYIPVVPKFGQETVVEMGRLTLLKLSVEGLLEVYLVHNEALGVVKRYI